MSILLVLSTPRGTERMTDWPENCSPPMVVTVTSFSSYVDSIWMTSFPK